MSWLNDYIQKTRGTDRLVERPDHLALLAAGLFGEAGSVLAELKKHQREREAYPAYRRRLLEEFGDLLWYLARIVDVATPNLVPWMADFEERKPLPKDEALQRALRLGAAIGGLLQAVNDEAENDVLTARVREVWDGVVRAAADVRITLSEAAKRNNQKTHSRWRCDDESYHELFDDDYPEHEQLPRQLEVQFMQVDRGPQKVSIMRCNSLNFGDHLTDNIKDPDFYRFHDVFHFAYAVHVGWSPVMRALLRCKRKSDPKMDETEDGARAGIIEEGVSAIVFSRAKEVGFYEGLDEVDYDLLKTIQEFVAGYEVAAVPLWQWERAIIDGFKVFRHLRANGGGEVTLDLVNRELLYRAPLLE